MEAKEIKEIEVEANLSDDHDPLFGRDLVDLFDCMLGREDRLYQQIAKDKKDENNTNRDK